MHLPDDVAIRISNHHGTRLKLLYSLWGDWLEAIGEPDHPDELFNCMLDAADCFQCMTFDFLHGYYRSAIANLRSALELVIIGVYGNVDPTNIDYLGWKRSTSELDFPALEGVFLCWSKDGEVVGCWRKVSFQQERFAISVALPIRGLTQATALFGRATDPSTTMPPLNSLSKPLSRSTRFAIYSSESDGPPLRCLKTVTFCLKSIGSKIIRNC